MPPKQPKAPSSRGKEDAKEDPLQAVVVADTFETRFAPFTNDRPRCLIPLANVPLIEYTLQYLASAGVRDVFFYAGAHAELVETYLAESKWLSGASPFRNFTMVRCVASSVGDIMRDLDSKDLVQGDFLCVSGDIVSDFPIAKALKVHKQRREKDKNAIMTMLLRERSESDQKYKNQILPTFVIDPTKDRCLHYEESLASAPFGTHIDPEILKNPEVDIRQDLIDCRIDICTPDMLSLWSENFDHQRPRKDFLYGVLKDYELNGKTLHTYIIEGYYANRVEDLSAYAAISHDLQHGMASSLVLTNNVAGTRFRRLRKDIVKEEDVIIQRPTRLGQGTVVGEGSSIGASTTITKTIVGRRCQIGRRTKISSAFVWDDVTIGSNVKIDKAIIGSEAFIGDNSLIEEGALISFGARVPAGSRVAAGKHITSSSTFGQNGDRSNLDDDHSDEEDNVEIDRYWPRTIYKQSDLNGSLSSIDSYVSDLSESVSKDGSRSHSFTTHGSEDDTDVPFLRDTAAILVQRLQEKRSADDMQSELMGLRFSGGADGTQVQKAVAMALSKHIHSEVGAGSSPDQASRKTLEEYRYLIRRQNAEQSTEEQVIFLLEAQLDLSRRPEGNKIMPFFVKDLYDLEVFEEESFTAWFEDERSKDEGVISIRDSTKPFIDWLATADEESEEDEDEDDDEDESD